MEMQAYFSNVHQDSPWKQQIYVQNSHPFIIILLQYYPHAIF